MLDNLINVLEENNKLTAAFAYAHQQEFLEFLLKYKVNDTSKAELSVSASGKLNKEDVVIDFKEINEVVENSSLNIPESTKLLEESYKEAEIIDVNNYKKDSALDLLEYFSDINIASKIGTALLENRITENDLNEFLVKLGIYAR